MPKAIPVAPPPKAQPVVDENTPRATPPKTKGPDDDMFDFATLAYDRQEWSIAAQSYAKYLQQYPTGRQVADALFRVGECYKNQNQLKQAGGYYEEVVNRYPSSEGAPSAAYRLGAMLFNDSKFADSAKYFAFCEAKTKSTPVRVAAAYHKSRAYGMLGDKEKQAAALTAVIAVKTDNQFRKPPCSPSAASTSVRTNGPRLFPSLTNSSKPAPTAPSSPRPASVPPCFMLSSRSRDESIAMFEKALRMPETSEQNRGISLVGIIQALYAKGDYDGVIDYYNKNSEILPQGASRAKMLLLVGHAYRTRKSYARRRRGVPPHRSSIIQTLKRPSMRVTGSCTASTCSMTKTWVSSHRVHCPPRTEARRP